MIMAEEPHGIAAETKADKARLIVLTDIEADADDSESLVRLLLYSSEIDIEAIIATTSVHQKTMVAPDTIRRTIEAYGKVQPNLLKHEAGFPDAKSLLARVSEGPAVYVMAGVGDDIPADEMRRREVVIWTYFLSFIVGLILFGFWVAIPIFLLVFLRFQAKSSWAMSFGLSIGASLAMYFFFERLFRVILHSGFVTDYVLSLFGR